MNFDKLFKKLYDIWIFYLWLTRSINLKNICSYARNFLALLTL